MLIQWRDFLIGEIQDKLRKNHQFFEAEAANYEASPLKHIIARFELIMNTYLREFVRASIDDWVAFMKAFTHPKYDKGELWKVQTTPMIIIHLNFRMKDDEKKKKAKAGKKKEGEAPTEDSEDEGNLVLIVINFFPKLSKVEAFFKNALKMIVESTNKVSNLEDDLMPFIKKEKRPNFMMTPEFPWIIEANQKIDAMF
jgi:hypothetical protein